MSALNYYSLFILCFQVELTGRNDVVVIIYNRVPKIFILCFQVELTGRNDEDIVIIYNRVPKTGSTSFAGIAYDLCSKNKFHVLHVNTTKNIHVLPLSDQVGFNRQK
jgi:hypothetical protein